MPAPGGSRRRRATRRRPPPHRTGPRTLEPPIPGDAGVPAGAVLERALLRAVVDAHDAEAAAVPPRPLVVVEERPEEVPPDVETVGAGLQSGGEVVAHVGGAVGVVDGAVDDGVLVRGAVLGDVQRGGAVRGEAVEHPAQARGLDLPAHVRPRPAAVGEDDVAGSGPRRAGRAGRPAGVVTGPPGGLVDLLRGTRDDVRRVVVLAEE